MTIEECTAIYINADDKAKIQIEETLNRLQRLPVSQAIDPHILCIIHPFFDSQHKRLQADRGT